MSDPAEVRRRELVQLVAERGFLRVIDARDELGVSEVTIRADLTVLEREGSIVRVHGGAMLRDAIREPSLESSRQRQAAAKSRIARSAAELVSSGESVFLDVGSTALAVATALVDRRELHDVVVVTNGLSIALALEVALPRFSVLVTGGTLRPLQHSLVNPGATFTIESLRFDLALIGCNGVHAENGVTNVNLPETEIKRQVIRAARRRVLVADGSKLGVTEVGVVGPLSDFDLLITAGEATPGSIEKLTAAGLRIEQSTSTREHT